MVSPVLCVSSVCLCPGKNSDQITELFFLRVFTMKNKFLLHFFPLKICCVSLERGFNSAERKRLGTRLINTLNSSDMHSHSEFKAHVLLPRQNQTMMTASRSQKRWQWT